MKLFKITHTSGDVLVNPEAVSTLAKTGSGTVITTMCGTQYFTPVSLAAAEKLLCGELPNQQAAVEWDEAESKLAAPAQPAPIATTQGTQ